VPIRATLPPPNNFGKLVFIIRWMIEDSRFLAYNGIANDQQGYMENKL